MSPDEIIRAWKDEEYLATLSDSERATLPDDPAGAIELSDRDLGDVSGAETAFMCITASIAASTAVSALACASIMHGTCSGWSYGCC